LDDGKEKGFQRTRQTSVNEKNSTLASREKEEKRRRPCCNFPGNNEGGLCKGSARDASNGGERETVIMKKDKGVLSGKKAPESKRQGRERARDLDEGPIYAEKRNKDGRL